MATNSWSSCRILVVVDFVFEKTNALLNLIKQQEYDYTSIDKIYLFAKDPNEVKCQYFLKKREKIDPENLKDLKAFIEYSSNMWMSMKILKSTMQTENIMY